MGVDPEVQARLLELYYELLSEEESAALREQIASDPQWAEFWAQTQQMAASLGEAAKLKLPRLELPRAGELARPEVPPETPPAEPARPVLLSESVRPGWPKAGPKTSPRLGPPIHRGRWAVGVVCAGAALLLIVALWGALVHRHHLLALTGEHLRLVVQGPSVLQAGVENHFLILTTRVHGVPAESQVELALFAPDQKRFFSQKENTDSSGQVRVVIPADMDLPEWVELMVRAEVGGKQESTSARVEVAPAQYQTFLALDRLYYRPGERVLFRSLTVNRFHRTTKEEMWAEFEVRDAEDRPVPGSYQEGRTWQGVGCGEFRIPPEWPSGLYMVAARNAQRRFPEVCRPFWVLPGPAEPIQVEVEFRQPYYAPGETVSVDMEFSRKGKPAADLPVEIRAEVLGRSVHQQMARTNAKGRLHSSFPLPERILSPDAWLLVKIAESKPPVLRWKEIPLCRPSVDVRFCPEGGVLVAGVENRVYFAARDAAGRPVELRGVLLDVHDRQVLEVRTTHAGRGVFQFIPAAEQRYRLRIVQPKGTREEPELPPACPEAKVLLKTGLGVVGPGRPVEFHLLSTPAAKSEMPLVAAVTCRGVQVGRQWVVPRVPEAGQPSETPVQIALAPTVWGPLRLSLYDYSQTPPVLLAERLLFRMPAYRVQAEVSVPGQPLRPKDSVQLRLSTKDERAAPISALSGLSVVEERLLGSLDGLSTISPFGFLDQIWEIPEDLQPVAYWLSENSQAQVALDLLLGTWGGSVGSVQTDEPSQPSEAEKPGQSLGPETTPPGTLTPEDAPPLVLDNLHRIRATYQEAMEVFQKDRTQALNAITLSSLLGGAALLLFVTLATLLRVSGGIRIWAPALIGAGLCVGIGLVLAHPGLLGAGGQYAAPFVEYPPSGDSEAHSSSSQPGSEPVQSAKEKTSSPSFSSSTHAPAYSSRKSTLPYPQVRIACGAGLRFGLPRNTLRRLLVVGSHEANLLVLEGPSQGSKSLTASLSPAEQPNQPAGKTVSDGSSSASSAGKEPTEPSASATSETMLAEAEDRVSGVTSPLPGTRFVVREYAYQAPRSQTPLDLQKARQVSLLYWHPFFLIGPEGSAECHFDLPELPIAFRIRADVRASEGRMALAEAKILSQAPLQIHLSSPGALSVGDRVLLPVSVQNFTSQQLSTELFLEAESGCRLTGESHRKLSLSPHGSQTWILPIEGKLLPAASEASPKGPASSYPQPFASQGVLKVHAVTPSWRQCVEKHFRIQPTGYPTEEAYAGWLEKSTPLRINVPSDALEGTLQIRAYLLPTFLAELDLAAQGLRQPPIGCLEPVLAVNALSGWAAQEIKQLSDCAPGLARLWCDRLRTGFDLLLQAQTPQGGFRAFVSPDAQPEHPVLTAWALVSFHPLTSSWPVESEPREQAARWIRTLQEQSGGFSIPNSSAEALALPSKEAVDVLLFWGLAETGQKNLDPHLLHVLRLVEKSKEPACVAMAALGVLRTGKTQEAIPLLEKLVRWQNDQGEIIPPEVLSSESSAPMFFGFSGRTARTALAALAWVQEPKFLPQAAKAIEWLARQRQADGTFGSPLATMLVLWALADYRNIQPLTLDPGEFRLQMEGKVVAQTSVSPEAFTPVVVEGLEKFLTPGEQTIHLEWTGSGRLPYLVVVSYDRSPRSEKSSPKEMPPNEGPAAGESTPTTGSSSSGEEAQTSPGATPALTPLQLKTSLSQSKTRVGETLVLECELANPTEQTYPWPMVVLGLPAGLEPIAQQLENLQKTGEVEWIAYQDRQVFCGWGKLGSRQSRKLALPLKATWAGRFTGPASWASIGLDKKSSVCVPPLSVEIASP